MTFRFRGLSELKMENFGPANILFGLEFSQCPNLAAFQVEPDSVMDRSGSFVAVAGEIVSVVLCSPDGKPA